MTGSSGSAQAGADYTNLNGTVTIPATQDSALVFVEPLFDDQIEDDETVTIKLTNTGDSYLIDAGAASATILIVDNLATNMFRTVTGLDLPIGIDYHQPSNSLIVSAAYLGGQFNFVRIYTNTVVSNIVAMITNWSGVHGVPDEVKLVTVKTTANGFTNGDMFFGSSSGIGWLSADGTSSNLNWCILTNSVESNNLPIRGGLCFDTSGAFSNQLIVVTSPGLASGDLKGVWRVRPNGTNGVPVLITNINTPHLEGVIVLTNDPATWGPWAGKIVTGDETIVPNSLIYAIDASGGVTSFDTTTFALGGIRTEDFEIIPPNQDLYACDQTKHTIVKLSRNYLTNFVGDLLITDEMSSKLAIVHWDAASTNFISRSFGLRNPNGTSDMFEHVTFAPIDLPTQ